MMLGRPPGGGGRRHRARASCFAVNCKEGHAAPELARGLYEPRLGKVAPLAVECMVEDDEPAGIFSVPLPVPIGHENHMARLSLCPALWGHILKRARTLSNLLVEIKVGTSCAQAGSRYEKGERNRGQREVHLGVG